MRKWSTLGDTEYFEGFFLYIHTYVYKVLWKFMDFRLELDWGLAQFDMLFFFFFVVFNSIQFFVLLLLIYILFWYIIIKWIFFRLYTSIITKKKVLKITNNKVQKYFNNFFLLFRKLIELFIAWMIFIIHKWKLVFFFLENSTEIMEIFIWLTWRWVL